MEKKRKGDCERSASENAKKKRGIDSTLPAYLIKTEKQFEENFGDVFSIEKKANLVLTEWDNAVGRAKIKTWLISLGPYFAGLFDKIKKNSEALLYPLLVNALVPVMELSACLIEASEQPPTTLSNEEKEEAAQQIALQSRSGSLIGLAGATKEKVMLDTTNATEVLEFIIYMEEVIKSYELSHKGRVELIIHDTTKPINSDKVAVVKAKSIISPDDREGFYQTCAYMAHTRVKYGIQTSHKAWEFLRLEEVKGTGTDGSVDSVKNKISHTPIFDLMKTSYAQLDEQAVDVYVHLLEIFSVPISTDLVASYEAAATATAARGDSLVARLK